MKSIKVYVYPADAYGCGHYRMIWPGNLVGQMDGFDVTVTMPNERQDLSAEINQRGELVGVQFPEDADVIVMQRVTHKYLRDAIPLIRSTGVAVVIDMDDDLNHIHPKNPAYYTFHPKSGDEHTWMNAQQSAERATISTVTTAALSDVYRGTHGCAILKNYVPEWYTRIEHRDSKTIGYAGSLHSHPDDVPELGSSIQQLTNQGHKFIVVANPLGMKTALGLSDEPGGPGAVAIEQWPYELTNVGVGLAPLANTRFNAAKSWLKVIESAAVGVPMIASPRADYRLLNEQYNVPVLWAKKPRDWTRQINRLLDDEALRKSMSQMGREAVKSWGLTYESKAFEWANIWKTAYEIERVNRPALMQRRRGYARR